MNKSLDLHFFDEATQVTTLNAPGNDLSAEMKTYYEKRLLDAAEPELVHDQFADKYPIPQGSGKTIEFRKYSALPKSLTALTEGTTPPGSKLNVSAVTATVSQYGDWIGMSDMLEMTAIDRNVEQATRLLGASAGRTLDTITREVLCGGTFVDWAGYTENGVYHASNGREDITSSCVLTPDMVFKAAAELKSQNAKAIDDSFVAIVHPYVAYDLMRSEEWIDAHKYASPEHLYAGEIGKLAGVRFVETTEAKIVAPDAICGVLKIRMKLSTALDATGSKDALHGGERHGGRGGRGEDHRDRHRQGQSQRCNDLRSRRGRGRQRGVPDAVPRAERLRHDRDRWRRIAAHRKAARLRRRPSQPALFRGLEGDEGRQASLRGVYVSL